MHQLEMPVVVLESIAGWQVDGDVQSRCLRSEADLYPDHYQLSRQR